MILRVLALGLAGCAAGSAVRVSDGVNVTLYVASDEGGRHAHPARLSEAQVRAALLKDGNLVDAQVSSIAAACAHELERLRPDQQLWLRGGVELALFVDEAAIVVGRLRGGRVTTRTQSSLVAAPPSEVIIVPSAIEKGDAGSDRARARALYESAVAHYNLGELKEAIADFKNAYRIVREAALLFNIAQCHRMLHDLPAALEMYRAYRREAPEGPIRAEVDRRIHEIEEQPR